MTARSRQSALGSEARRSASSESTGSDLEQDCDDGDESASPQELEPELFARPRSTSDSYRSAGPTRRISRLSNRTTPRDRSQGRLVTVSSPANEQAATGPEPYGERWPPASPGRPHADARSRLRRRSPERSCGEQKDWPRSVLRSGAHRPRRWGKPRERSRAEDRCRRESGP
jgi:hypothetical protein